jgi:heterodisulfide reductase subunit C
MEDVLSVAERLKAECGVDAAQCYQCGKCTAGCPMAVEMDFPPSYLMRLLQTDSEENYQKVLHSKAIWLCVACEQCIGRCPKAVDIPVLMDALRSYSLAAGSVHKEAADIVRFHHAFLDSVKYTGRLSEVGLIADYKLRSAASGRWANLLQDVCLAPSMWLKGKLHFIPEFIKDTRAMRRIFTKKKEVQL